MTCCGALERKVSSCNLYKDEYIERLGVTCASERELFFMLSKP